MTHSALSVPSNIAEGFQRETAKEKRGFFITLKAL
ncbi:four helix bundle protein [Vibrio chemaguriensis]